MRDYRTVRRARSHSLHSMTISVAPRLVREFRGKNMSSFQQKGCVPCARMSECHFQTTVIASLSL